MQDTNLSKLVSRCRLLQIGRIDIPWNNTPPPFLRPHKAHTTSTSRLGRRVSWVLVIVTVPGPRPRSR